MMTSDAHGKGILRIGGGPPHRQPGIPPTPQPPVPPQRAPLTQPASPNHPPSTRDSDAPSRSFIASSAPPTTTATSPTRVRHTPIDQSSRATNSLGNASKTNTRAPARAAASSNAAAPRATHCLRRPERRAPNRLGAGTPPRHPTSLSARTVRYTSCSNPACIVSLQKIIPTRCATRREGAFARRINEITCE